MGTKTACSISGGIFTRMKIVILDAYVFNPGDLSWDGIRKFGEVEIYDRSTREEVISRIQDADIVLTNKALVSREAIENARQLKFIAVMATGYNSVDIIAAKEMGIPVSNVPAYSTPSVAQIAITFMLTLANHIPAYTQSVQNGDWPRSPDYSYTLAPLMELQDKTLGIIGFGQIGQAVARIALAFGMKVIASHKHPERDRMEGVTFTSQDEVFEQADFISLHCPLNDQNREFLNSALIRKMKPSAFLINTSRGGLINENDLADALNNHVIAGAGLDVLSTEPPVANNPLLSAKNCLITPHIAWASKEARMRLMEMLNENIASFINGNPHNVVN